MADYNWDMRSGVGGYLGEDNIPVWTDNAHQNESGSKEGDENQRRDEAFRGSPGRLTFDGAAQSGIGGSKLCNGALSKDAGASGCSSHGQIEFGLVGTTRSPPTARSDRHLGEADTSSKAAFDPRASASDEMTAADGDAWRPEDLMHAQGSKKHEVMNKIKEKMPGHHDAAALPTTDPKGAPKKSLKEKIKEKLPGQHGNDAGM